jgi:PAS domain S-box-containing protein
VPDEAALDALDPLADSTEHTDPERAAARAAVSDPDRLAAVRATGLLDAPVTAFDRLTRLAARLLRAPAAFVSLVDADRDVYVSAFGFDEPLASSRELTGETFCHYTVAGGSAESPLVIGDTAAHHVYRDVPTVRSLGVAAYVGVPLVVGGHPVGALCVIDTAPRDWTPEEVEVLGELADSGRRELELRAALGDARRAEDARRTAEAGFDIAVEAAEMGVWQLDLERDAATRRSPRHDQLFGYDTPQREWGQEIAKRHVHEDDRAAFDAAFSRARKSGNLKFEVRTRWPDGSIHWMGARGRFFFDENGTPVRGAGVNFDVTERKEAEWRLRQSEERYALAARATNNAIWDWNLLTDELTWNEGVYEAFGYEPGTVPNGVAWWYDSIHPEDRERVVAGIQRRIDGEGGDEGAGNAWRDEYRFRRGDGTYAIASDRGYVARDAEGRATRMIGAMVDVSAERATAEEREAARELAEGARLEAETANRARGEFLAVMSHELRTPLNAIGGYAELIEMGVRGPVTELQLADLARIKRSQRHLLGLVNEVLNYAKLESGSVQYDIEDVEVMRAVVDAESLVAPQARGKGLSLSHQEWPPDLSVRADPEKLRQVLVNLLSNAVKFTDRGGAEITVSCNAEGNTVSITVRDTGIGIPFDKLGAIFEPFVQVRADLTRTAEGTGLGLAISRDLARGMAGELTVESEAGVGSGFTLTLPRSKK